MTLNGRWKTNIDDMSCMALSPRIVSAYIRSAAGPLGCGQVGRAECGELRNMACLLLLLLLLLLPSPLPFDANCVACRASGQFVTERGRVQTKCIHRSTERPHLFVAVEQ
jgi:hypothetical protein